MLIQLLDEDLKPATCIFVMYGCDKIPTVNILSAFISGNSDYFRINIFFDDRAGSQVHRSVSGLRYLADPDLHKRKRDLKHDTYCDIIGD